MQVRICYKNKHTEIYTKLMACYLYTINCVSLLLTVVLNTLREFLLQVLVHRTYPFRGGGVHQLASLNVTHSDGSGSKHGQRTTGASLVGVVPPTGKDGGR